MPIYTWNVAHDAKSSAVLKLEAGAVGIAVSLREVPVRKGL